MNAAFEARETIRLIRRSITAFRLGVAGLVPLLGLVCALGALVVWGTTRRRRGTRNPAQRYLNWSVWLALAGMALTLGVGGLVYWVNAPGPDGSGCCGGAGD